MLAEALKNANLADPSTTPKRSFSNFTGAKKTCLAIAKAYGCKPEQVWATWEEIPPQRYVEGEKAAELQPSGTHPPIGQLICFEGKSDEEIETVLMVAAATLSESLEIPGNIFLTYQEALSGRVIAGNGIVRK